MGASTPVGWVYQFASAVANGPFYLRFYIRVHTAPSANTYIATLSSSATLGTLGNGCQIQLNTSRTLSLVDNSGLGAGNSSALTLDTWYRVEIKIDNGAASVTALLDGTQFGTSSNVAAVLALKIGGNLDNGTNTGGDWFFDDIAINDNTGTSQTSYPDVGNITNLRPSAAGDNTTWTIAGTSPAATNWQSVNEVTPNDGTTILTKIAAGSDDYNIDDTPAGIGSGDTINVVAVGVRSATGTASSGAQFATRIKKAASGTVSQGTTILPTTTTYQTNKYASPHNYQHILYNDPDGSAWTKATLDTAQVGIIWIAGAGTLRPVVSTVWVSVDSAPAAVVATAIGPGWKTLLGVGQVCLLFLLKILKVI